MHIGLASGFGHQRGDAYPHPQFVQEETENLVLAEELGFDSVWITEHHFSDYSTSNDPLQLLTYIAGRTKRVKLGTQVICAPWHHPVRLAEKIINLDILSRGRVILGFGNGLAPDEFVGLGIDQTIARELYAETLDLVIPAIETGVIEGKSKHFNQPRRELRPGPLKTFNGRKFSGSSSGGSMDTAARHGCGNMILTLPQRGGEVPPDKYTGVWKEVHGEGSSPPPPIVSGHYFVDESADYAEEQGRLYEGNNMRAAALHYNLDKPGTYANLKTYEYYERMTFEPDGMAAFVERGSKAVVAGTPQMLLERLWELKEIFQPQGFFPQLNFGGMPQDLVRKNIELFAKKVVPEVKSWKAEISLDDRFQDTAR